MTDSVPPAPANMAGDWYWMWEVYVVLLCGGAIAAVVLMDHRFPGHVRPACVALAGIAVCTLVFGRTVIRAVPAPGEVLTVRACVFLATVIVLWLVALAAAPLAVAAVPALFPVIFATLPLPGALAVTLLVAATPLVSALLVHGPQWSNTPLAAAITLVSAVIAPIIGTTIVTSMRQRRTLAEAIAQLAASRAEATRLSRDAGVAAERERLAHEIHDTLAQGFTSIVALAQAVQAELGTDPAAAARHVELIRNTARDNLAEARTMVTKLTPAALGEGSLVAALRRQCDNLADETGIAVTLRIGDVPGLTMATNVVLLRTAQEALANVRRHAGASSATVDLDSDARFVRLSLSDNGIGLQSDHADGFGLRGMRTRLAQVGGELTLGAPPGGGLTVTVQVPA